MPYHGNYAKRLNQQAWMICNCIRNKASSYEALSVDPASNEIDMESEIKNTSRWMKSKWTDFDTFYFPYARFLLNLKGKSGEINLAIDGSELGEGCTTLMLSLIWDKQSIPICWVTRKGPKGHFPEEMHLALIEQANVLLTGIDARVVLLGDGEFDGVKLRKRCVLYKWEFALRTAKNKKVTYGDEECRIDKTNFIKGDPPLFIEDACDGDNAVVCWDIEYDDPIYLLTNMELGEMACLYYKRRFKIEAMFKQFKSAGFNIQKSKVRDPKRIDNLLIIISLAYILTMFIGLMISIKPKRSAKKFLRLDRISTLSLIRIGQKCITNSMANIFDWFGGIVRVLNCIFAGAA